MTQKMIRIKHIYTKVLKKALKLLRFGIVICPILVIAVKIVIVGIFFVFPDPTMPHISDNELKYSYAKLNKYGNDTSGCPNTPQQFIRVSDQANASNKCQHNAKSCRRKPCLLVSDQIYLWYCITDHG